MWVAAGSVAVLGARDPGSTRIVYGIVIALIVLGAGLAVLAWWLTRTTRPDPELLAPLEAIDGRRWRDLDPAGRRRLLDELRPDGAQPVDPAPAEPPPDDEFDDEPVSRDVRELAADAEPDVDADDDDDDDDDDDERPAAVSPVRRPEDWRRWDTELGLEAADDGD